jgi:hypothetical protein
LNVSLRFSSTQQQRAETYAAGNIVVDDDSWINITNDELDARMRQRTTELNPSDLCDEEDFPSDSDDENGNVDDDANLHQEKAQLDHMVDALSSFLGKTSTFEGIEDDQSSSDDSNQDIDFDVDHFISALKTESKVCVFRLSVAFTFAENGSTTKPVRGCHERGTAGLARVCRLHESQRIRCVDESR